MNKLIYSDDSNVGLFDLSLVSEVKRPAEEESEVWNLNRMIFGYCEPVAFLGIDRSPDELLNELKKHPV